MINIGCDIKIGTNIENAKKVIINTDGRVVTETEDKNKEFTNYEEITPSNICLGQNVSRTATLPSELNTSEALVILNRLHDHGLLSADYQPAQSLALKEKVILAAMISQTLWDGKNHWTTFQNFWNIRNMSSLYTQAMKQQKSGSFITKINSILRV